MAKFFYLRETESEEADRIQKEMEELRNNPKTRLYVSSVPKTLEASEVYRRYKDLETRYKELPKARKWVEVNVIAFVSHGATVVGVCMPLEKDDTPELIPYTELYQNIPEA